MSIDNISQIPTMVTYLIILAVLFALEVGYFRIADRFNIIDKPNERSSHSTIVLRGGGIIFTLSMIVWWIMQMVHGEWCTVNGYDYLPFMIGLVMVAGVSFWDDVKSLPDSVRMSVQMAAILLMSWSMGILTSELWWSVPIVMLFCVALTNIVNFMDGINGITAGYSLAVLVPLIIENGKLKIENGAGFIEPSYLLVAILGVLVFSVFNFRPKGKAKCFAGDVGSIGIAFIMLFAVGKLIFHTGDFTYIIVFLVYGVDGLMTIFHRMMMHEHLGQAHRKHAYQIMANELKIGHVKVALLYMAMQLAVSLGFVFLCPDTVAAHWTYLIAVSAFSVIAYIVFMKKYYHLHEAYLASLERKEVNNE